MKEREISLVDLMVEVLLHWRMFIVWMLIGAVLLGAFSYVRSNSAARSQQAQTEEIQREPEEWLTEEEIQNVKYVRAYEAAYLAEEDYLEKSAVMNMDPNQVCKADATIVIDADERQKSCDIEKVYEDIVLSGELAARIAEDSGTAMANVNEMIFLNQGMLMSGPIFYEELKPGPVFYEENTNSFQVSVLGNDEEQCKNMLETVLVFLKEKQPDIEKTFGKYEIVIADQSFGIVADTQILNKQTTVLNSIANMKKVLADAKDALSDKEKQYYDLLMKDEETEEVNAVAPAPVAPGVSVKHVALGAVMAAFLYAFILFMIYIFNTKIRATDNLQELYDISQLGVIPSEKSDKKLFGFIDKWFLSFRDRNKRQFTSEEALGLVSVAVKMSAGKEALQEIGLIGCGLKERSLDACEKIKARLESDGVQAGILNNVLYDARAMEELERTKAVVLVESAGSTLYNEVVEELELLGRQGIKVLGGIIVE